MASGHALQFSEVSKPYAHPYSAQKTVFCARLCKLHGQGRAHVVLRCGFGSLGSGHRINGLVQFTGLSSLGQRVQHGADLIQLG